MSARAAGTVLATVAALLGFASISTDLYLPAMPTLARTFGVDDGRIQLTLTTFLVGFSLGQLIWGPIGDRAGRRKPLMIGIATFVVGSVGCALSGGVGQMIAWRLVQATGAAAGPVLGRAIVRDLYGREKAAQMLSLLMLVMAVAPLLGPILGGQILAFWSWRAIFWTLAGLGTVVAGAVYAMPETLAPADRSAEPIARSFAEYAELVRDPTILGYAVSGGLFYIGIYAYVAGAPFAYIDFYHVPASYFGLLFGVNILGIMVLNVVNARLVPRYGSRALFLAGTVVAAAAGAALAFCAATGTAALLGLLVPLFLYNAVFGPIIANAVANAMAARPRKAGATAALVGAMHYGSGVLGTGLLAWFADGSPRPLGWIVAIGGAGALVVAVAMQAIGRADGGRPAAS